MIGAGRRGIARSNFVFLEERNFDVRLFRIRIQEQRLPFGVEIEERIEVFSPIGNVVRGVSNRLRLL